MCQWRSITCNKYTTLVGNADNGESYASVGVEGMLEISPHSPQFCSDSKNSLKNLMPSESQVGKKNFSSFKPIVIPQNSRDKF